jgi:RNA polymerase sigma-70 factor (ECF subfamily)
VSYLQASNLRAEVHETPEMEAKLVREAAQGSRPAFDRLREIHSPGIRTFLGSRVGDPQVEDILQDVWIAAWTAMPRFRQGSQFKTWLFAICFNKYRDYCRAQKRRPQTVQLDEGIQRASASDHASALESSENVRSLLAQLSEEQREVLDLYYAGEMNLREVSEVLDRNLNTVKYQFYRGLANMERMLRQQDKEVGR